MDYATYWTIIFGDRSAEDVVREFDLGGRYPYLRNWLGQVEEEARVMGAALDEDEVFSHRAKALEEIDEARLAA